MFKEYDVVVAVKSLSAHVFPGCIGVVLLCLDSDHYEVEFVDGDGESLEVLTVSEAALELKEDSGQP
ncbi:DUF4926 domain-containing protein [Pseudomonas japonica]|uniref:DUF4926 domain-containing protein n=1 Tax=Pseudomonas japonica TaxID=256466 RepID=UPI0009FE6D2A|nr:DUF4926 domain-containing protein [Pseudomonas japonica]